MVIVHDALDQTIGASRSRFADWIDSLRPKGRDGEWGIEQSRICAEFAGLDRHDPAFTPLVASFVLIAGYQAEMDRQIDGQARTRSDLVAVAGAFATAQEILHPLKLERSGPEALSEFSRLMADRAVDHAFALRFEIEGLGHSNLDRYLAGVREHWTSRSRNVEQATFEFLSTIEESA